jgi:hypothetical protein
LKAVVRNPDAASGFEYNRNSSRESLRNSNLYLIAVTDPCFSGNLSIELEPARDNEVGSLGNDAESGLPDQKFFKLPTRWNIRSDGDLPTAAVSSSGSPTQGSAQLHARGQSGLLRMALTVLR